jgi:hypothetical protein
MLSFKEYTFQKVPICVDARDENGEIWKTFSGRQITLRFREVAEESLPIVISFTDGKVGTARQHYRQDPNTGQMYYMSGMVKRLEEGYLSEVLPYIENTNIPALGRFTYADTQLYKATADKIKVWPPRDTYEHKRSIPRHEWVPSLYQDLPNDFSIDEADINAWKQEKQTAIDELVIIKNRVWSPCHEPRLVVSRGNAHWNINLTNNEHFPKDWMRFDFSANEFEFAKDWINVLNAEHKTRETRETNIDVSPSFVSTRNHIAVSTKRLAYAAMENLIRGNPALHEQHPEIIATYAQLKSFLAKDNQTISDEMSEDVMLKIARICEIDREGGVVYNIPEDSRRTLNGNGNHDPKEFKRYEKAVNLHIRRLRERPIEIGITSAPVRSIA